MCQFYYSFFFLADIAAPLWFVISLSSFLVLFEQPISLYRTKTASIIKNDDFKYDIKRIICDFSFQLNVIKRVSLTFTLQRSTAVEECRLFIRCLSSFALSIG